MIKVNIRFDTLIFLSDYLLRDFEVANDLFITFWRYFQNILGIIFDYIFPKKKIIELPKKVSRPLEQAVGFFHSPFTNFHS